MKLTNRQTTTIIAALRFWQGEARGPITADTCTSEEIDALCERFNTQDVWAVKCGLIEQIGGNVEKLTSLHEELRKVTQSYVDRVRAKRTHVPSETNAATRRSCRKCGRPQE